MFIPDGLKAGVEEETNVIKTLMCSSVTVKMFIYWPFIFSKCLAGSKNKGGDNENWQLAVPEKSQLASDAY